MSLQLQEVVERARREPAGRFHSLAHLIDVPALKTAYRRVRKDAAVGVDGVTKDQYRQNLESNLEDLHARLKSMRYRHQPIRRVHLPKDGGRTRPIGISALEDKIVQGAVRDVLEALQEGASGPRRTDTPMIRNAAEQSSRLGVSNARNQPCPVSMRPR